MSIKRYEKDAQLQKLMLRYHLSFFNLFFFCWNCPRDFFFTNLEVGDAYVIFNVCKQKQVGSLNFFYVIQCINVQDPSQAIFFLEMLLHLILLRMKYHYHDLFFHLAMKWKSLLHSWNFVKENKWKLIIIC